MMHLPDETSLLHLIIQTAPDAIITAGQDGKILSFSPAAERIFGFAEEEVKGQNLTCLMPEPHRTQHDAYMEHYLQTGERHVIGIGREVQARRKSGETFVAELAVGELVIGEIRIFTGFIRDVSDRVNAEARARDLMRSLERIARVQMLGEMSSALAHEINQPLAAIANYAQASERSLESSTPDLENLRKQISEIADQSLRAGEIIRRMRKLVDRGVADIKPDDINDIIHEAVRVGRATSPHHGPRIELELADNLPNVLADRIQIQQVLINLMNNAFEAVHDEDAPVKIISEMAPERDRIILRAKADSRKVMVSVSDSGPGIEPTHIDRIFNPLFTSKETGLGVGLAVCRSIIHAHGGEIWAENSEHGADFHFTLPIAGGAA